ncbi:MAG: shikimate kinase AroK [Gammaproteobacteria bacterium]
MLGKTQNLFLVGPIGAGKTTIGRYIARSLHRKFFDTDQEVESRTGVDLNWIFDMEGEEGFRDREAAVIDELTQETGAVLSTGGGSILRESNRHVLAARGLVVYLQVSIEQQVERTLRDTKRPILQKGDKQSVLETILREREPLYEEIADLSFPTDNRTVRSVAETILQQIRSVGG